MRLDARHKAVPDPGGRLELWHSVHQSLRDLSFIAQRSPTPSTPGDVRVKRVQLPGVKLSKEIW